MLRANASRTRNGLLGENQEMVVGRKAMRLGSAPYPRDDARLPRGSSGDDRAVVRSSLRARTRNSQRVLGVLAGAIVAAGTAITPGAPALAQADDAGSTARRVVHCLDTGRQIVVRVLETECDGRILTDKERVEIARERDRRIKAIVASGSTAGRTEAIAGDLATLERAAAAGDAAASYALGLRYETAQGIPRDYVRAAHRYCRAARGGHVEAGYTLGWMFAYGRGVARDDRRAASWLAWAREQGHPHAAQSLDVLGYSKPYGAPRCGPSLRDVRPPPEIAALIHELAPAFDSDPRLIMAIAAVESGFRTDAVSPKNARGLMQLMPGTAERFGVGDVFDPRENLIGALRYLNWLKARFQGDLTLMLAAYNAGENAVERYGGIPPYPETQGYVETVLALYGPSS